MVVINIVGYIKHYEIVKYKILNSLIDEALYPDNIEKNDYTIGYTKKLLNTEYVYLTNMTFPNVPKSDIIGSNFCYEGKVHKIVDFVINIDGTFDFVIWSKDNVIGIQKVEEAAEQEINKLRDDKGNITSLFSKIKLLFYK